MDAASSQLNWTAQQRTLLQCYVTSIEGNVFALRNLPEVLKGALFSRYSRSRLGLRELLLKEFIAEEAVSDGFATSSQVDMERADAFYRRVLDAYGDDSVGELGGAHLALEQISMLAAKAVQDARIGGSPLEKSTRYVSFADKQQGEYRFYRDDKLMASRHRQKYLAACNALFEGYQRLQQPLSKFFHNQPRPADKQIGQKEWEVLVRTRTLDALRGLLPTAALTNMGVFGNGRFFENLLQRLSTSPLSECCQLAQSSHTALQQVIPSFVRRAHAQHRHFQMQQEHQQQLEAQLHQLAEEQSTSLPAPASDAPLPAARQQQFKLLHHDPQAPAKVAAALSYAHSQLSLESLQPWADSHSLQELKQLFTNLAACRRNRRHKPPRATELAFYTFECTADYGIFRDLHRHRMLTQQRQLLTPHLGWTLPPEIAHADLKDDFQQLIHQAAQTYQHLAADFSTEAQYVLPMAFHIRWYMHINLRSLIWLTELRSSEQGHAAYRQAAQQMHRQVCQAHPAFAPLFTYVNTSTSQGRIQASKNIVANRQPSLIPDSQL